MMTFRRSGGEDDRDDAARLLSEMWSPERVARLMEPDSGGGGDAPAAPVRPRFRLPSWIFRR